MDASNITVPIWSILGAVSITVTVIMWAFNQFERKEDADDKYSDLKEALQHQGELIQGMSNNLNYIRGKIEHKE